MRLLKNQDRRQIREKQGKGKRKTAHFNANTEASPDPSSADKAAAGTTRKCANCGQVGHIKTNKRYWHNCSLLRLFVPPSISPATQGSDFLLVQQKTQLANFACLSKCPLLNGTISTNNNGADHGGFGSFSTPAAAQPAGD